MKIRGRLRSAAIILLAAGTPPLIAWLGTSIVRASSPPPSPPKRVENFADYMTGPRDPAKLSLTGGAEVWTGSPGAGIPFFTSLTLGHDALALLSAGRLVTVDLHSRKVLRDISTSENPIFGAIGASSVAPGSRPDQLWLYTAESGNLGLYDLGNGFSNVASLRVDPGLRSALWVNDRIVANGPFRSELVRIYGTPQPSQIVRGSNTSDSSAQSRRSLDVVGTLGRPLFPSITGSFSPHLNSTFIDVNPGGDHVAVAYQWSSRIDVYDVKRRELVRSIAGPVESKLDFAVAGSPAKPILTLSDETQWSYVDVAVSDDAIYALYAGRVRKKYGMSFALGTEIHVFTWDGRLVGEWRLQDPLQTIRIDPRTRTLYGLRWKPTKSIMAIDMSTMVDAVERVRRGGSVN